MRSIALKLLIVMVALNMVILPLNAKLAVICGYAILLLSAWVPIDLMLNSGNHLSKKQIHLVIAFLAVTLINSALSIFQFQLSDVETVIKAFVSFFAFMLALSVGESTYTERDLNFYFTANQLLSLVFIIYTVIPFGFQRTVVGDYGYLQFTLSMGNPNATATKVMFCVLLLMIQRGISKKAWIRWLNMVLIIGLLYTLYNLESRTALACALLGIVLGTAVNFRVTKKIADICWSIPILFIPVQIVFEQFPALRLLGKSLVTGREELFSDFIVKIATEPHRFILGNFLSYQLQNYHNIFFTILFNFGIVGVVLYYKFWRAESRKLRDQTSKIANYAWIAILAFVVQSATEAAAMSGSFTFGAIIILLNRMTKDTFIVTPGTEERYDLTLKTRRWWKRAGEREL